MKKNVVHLVGAGPGDPGLITKRGLDLLRRADAVVYDALVNPALLLEAPQAQIIYVGKRGGARHAMAQEKINSLLVRLAGQGKRVVRLKGGDPFVFGRGGEEVEALKKAHVPYEIVPGVTSAIAAPAYAGIPVSDRRWSSQVTFFTGHEGRPTVAGSSNVDWDALSSTGTLVVLMGVAEWPSIRRNLLERNWPKNTPVAAIESGTNRDQRVITTTLDGSKRDFKKQRLKAPAVIVVGRVANLAKTRSWVKETKPLLGKTVVVTRAVHQNEKLTGLLEDRGAHVIECPAIATRPLQGSLRLREIVSHLSEYDWVLLLSVNAVEAFALLLDSKKDLLKKTRLCAIGPATAQAIRSHGWAAHRTARVFNSQGIVKILGALRGKHLLLPRVQGAPPDLVEALRKRGALVDEVATYETITAPPPPDAIKQAILKIADAVTFTSASTAHHFATFFSTKELVGLFRRATALSIGPVTSAVLKKMKIRCVVEAKQSTVEHMVEKLCRVLAALLLFSAPVFSAEPAVRELLVRYKQRPAVGKTLAVPQAQIPTRTRASAQKMAAFQAATSVLERTVVVPMTEPNLEEELARWRSRSDVEFVEPNYPMKLFLSPDDPLYSNQWALRNTGQSGNHDPYDPPIGDAGRDVDAESAWNITTGSNTIVVAVIDAGINITHPDLAANIVTGFDFGDNDSNPDDTCFNANALLNAHGHGTHVSGIIGAVGNNGVGVAGLSWTGKIMPLKVADSSCEIFTDDVVSAINYARTNGAHVINMSLGGQHSVALDAAIDAADAADIVLVAAAGNEGNPSETPTNSYPAFYSNVIAVAATDRNDQLATFSNHGTWIDISAPGVGILSTYPADLGTYGYLSGTSMATPLVAAAAALVLADDPALTSAQVRTRLLTAADNIDSQNIAYIGKMGAGRLNVLNALYSITSVSPSTAPNTGPQIITMGGFNLTGSTDARLVRTGETDVVGTGLGVQSASVASVTFNLNGLQGGRWDIVLGKSGGRTTRLVDGLGVLSDSFNVLLVDPSVAYIETVEAVQGTQTVNWPAGVLSQTISLDLDAAPTLPAVDSSVDPYVATGIGIELTPSVAGLDLNQAFTLTLTYRDIDLADPNKPTALTVAYYNEDTGRWEPITSVVDTAAKTVTASISHLSLFAILQHVASANLGNAHAYPNPFRAEQGHNKITFDFLTAGARVRIYDINGGLVQDLTDDNNDGQIFWNDVKNDSGERVASGMYFYLITDPGGRKETGRIGVIR